MSRLHELAERKTSDTGKRRRDRGASLIETALVLPMLLMLAFGATEVGFLVVDYMTVSNAARGGVRIGAAAGDYHEGSHDADDLILESVEQAACNLDFSKLERVSVYKADEDGNPIDPAGQLNEYGGTVDCADGVVGLVCTNGCPWDPSARDASLPNLDYLGVEVEFTHEGVTKIVPLPTVTFTERAVMRLEPQWS